jgi:hypothetical protein
MKKIDDGKVAERLCACGCGASLAGRSRLARFVADRCRAKDARAKARQDAKDATDPPSKQDKYLTRHGWV